MSIEKEEWREPVEESVIRLREACEEYVGQSGEASGGGQGDHPGQYHVAHGRPAHRIDTLEEADADNGGAADMCG